MDNEIEVLGLNSSGSVNYNIISIGFFTGAIGAYGHHLFFKSAYDLTCIPDTSMYWGYPKNKDLPNFVENYKPVQVTITIK